MVTNAAVPEGIAPAAGRRPGGLQGFLNTGKSPQFDGEKILGIWNIDVAVTTGRGAKAAIPT